MAQRALHQMGGWSGGSEEMSLASESAVIMEDRLLTSVILVSSGSANVCYTGSANNTGVGHTAYFND